MPGTAKHITERLHTTLLTHFVLWQWKKCRRCPDRLPSSRNFLRLCVHRTQGNLIRKVAMTLSQTVARDRLSQGENNVHEAVCGSTACSTVSARPLPVRHVTTCCARWPPGFSQTRCLLATPARAQSGVACHRAPRAQAAPHRPWPTGR